MNAEKIISKIKKYEYVSFDIFDTAIKRNVSSNKKILFSAYKNLFENSVELEKIIDDRIKIEFDIWENDYKNFTFDNIYRVLEGKYDVSIVKKCKEQEILAELEYTTINPQFKRIYDYCLENDKKVVFISDMYLSKEIIAEVLKKNGVLKYYKLYVSSEEQALKSNGKLYAHVLEDLKISPKKLIHIGDNFKGDYYRARQKGVFSIKIPTYVKNVNKMDTSSLEKDYIYNLMNNNILCCKTACEKIGFEYLGVLLIGLCKWIHRETSFYNCSKVLFLSRDGYIVKKAYDILYPGNDSVYFLTSRRSITVPLLSDVTDYHEIRNIVKFRQGENVKNYLKRCGIDNLSGLENYDFSNTDILDEILQLKFEDIKQNAEIERKAFYKYFEDNVNQNEILLFDIGWHGTTQDSIQKLLGNKYKVIGLYLGLSEGETERKKCFSSYSSENMFSSALVASFRGIVETMFSADHSSVKRYSDKGLSVELMADNYTLSDDVSEIFLGALSFIKLYSNNDFIKQEEVELDKSFYLDKFYNLITRPKLKDLKIFSDVSFYDVEDRKLISKVNIINVKKFYRLFVESDWKIGYLKYNFLFFNFYKELVVCIYKMFR